ncbi:MAG: hypothetical protein V4819_07660 [Verrucomicrobiota bacterium]
MSNPRSRLIETAVRPFDDNAEMKLSASKLLEELATGEREGEEGMIHRWETVDARKRRPVWSILLYAVLTIISAALLIDAAKVVIGFENTISTMGGSDYVDFFHNSPKITEKEIAGKLTPDEARLLFGDLSRHSAAERVKVLWDSEPENPAYFAQYVDAYLDEFKNLPPDFLKDGRRIDPENAWFTYVAAGVRAKDAVKKRPQSKAATPAHATPEWDVTDAAAMNDSLALLREARNQPKYETYRTELGRAQMKLLSIETPAEVTFSLGYRIRKSTAAEIAMVRLGFAMAAKAWLCGGENDPDSFKELLADAEGFLRKRMDSEVDSTLGELVTMRAGYNFISNAAPSAEKLGLADEANRLGGTWEIFKRREAENQMRKSNLYSELLNKHGGGLASLFGHYPVMQNPPLLPLEDVKPGRLMDHETLAWTASYFAWALLVLGMGLASVFRFRSPVLIRRLTVRLELLMLPRDWLLVFGVGVVLPIVYFIAVTRFTPLGGRELSVHYGDLSFAPYFDNPPLGFAQPVGLAMLMIFSCGALSCWCLRKRTKSFTLVTARSASLLIPIACLVAFIPVSGWAVAHSSNAPAVTAWVLAGIAVFWVILVGFMSFFGQFQTQLRHGIIARMLVPSCALAALLVLSAAPYFKMRAHHWSAKDLLLRPDADFPSGSTFEHRIALQLRKELRETLGYDR